MVYYNENNVLIRDMEPADVQIFVDGERAQAGRTRPRTSWRSVWRIARRASAWS